MRVPARCEERGRSCTTDADVAQLADAPASDTGQWGFDSLHPHLLSSFPTTTRPETVPSSDGPLRGNPGGTMASGITSHVPCYAYDVGPHMHGRRSRGASSST